MSVFLFTDLESSTRLWEQHPDEMKKALARHDEILRRAVSSSHGSVVKSTGDGLMAVFPAIPGAVSACVDGQRALGRQPWAETGPLRVRMGLHAGDAEQREGDFFGPVVNRAARIMAAGHGGQILLSADAADLAHDALPEGATLRDLGSHRLKDLGQPEHLFQVLHADIQSDFPPLSTLDLRPNNLPVQVSEFFGRTAELEAIRATLEQPSVRLVTLTGPGGTGKTRLGLQMAAELLDDYPDGVFFVDLSSERDPDAAFETMVRDLGMVGSREGGPLQILKTKLRDSRMLLVLDNLEQVAAVGIGLADLLRHCPGLVIIVTSREALRVRGEHVFPVPPLGLPEPRAPLSVVAASEAVALFTERARSAKPDFALTEDNSAAVAEISVRLDGLPLALELAAARLKVFTAGDLLDRLGHRIDVLGSGARDLPDRQRTLRGTIEWSYELLDPDECQVFELIAVFSSARLEAIEEVTARVHPDLDVLEVVASLMDKSLIRTVESAGSHRFSMLQTIREYATERLEESPQEQEIRLAHATYFVDYASDLTAALEGSERPSALEDVSSEIGNLRTAWQFWVEAEDLGQLHLLLDGLWALHDTRGWYHGVIDLIQDLLAVLATTEPSPERDQEEMTLRTSLARALMAVRGYTAEVEDEYTRALELSANTGDPAHRFPVLRALATYYVNLADFENTVSVGRQLLELAEAENDTAWMVEGHVVLGAGSVFSGDPAGLGHFERAIELFDPKMHGSGRFRLGSSPGVIARTTSAFMFWQAGFPEQAAARSDDAVMVARSLDHPYSLAYALWHAAFLDLVRERFEEAHRLADELAVLSTENDYPVWRALSSVMRGVCECALGRADGGLALTEAGLGLYGGMTTPPVFWPQLLSLRSMAFAMAGQPEQGLEVIDEAISMAGAKEAAYPDLRIVRGDQLAMLADPDLGQVEESYRSAIRGARAIGGMMIELMAWTRLVSLLRAGGTPGDESEELRAVYARFTEGFDEAQLVAARRLIEDV